MIIGKQGERSRSYALPFVAIRKDQCGVACFPLDDSVLAWNLGFTTARQYTIIIYLNSLAVEQAHGPNRWTLCDV
jgi:hypothetical protein